MLVCTLLLIMAFRTSEAMAHAYGVAVAATMLGTCVLYFVHAWRTWHVPKYLVVIPAIIFITLDATLLGANLLKVPMGGWVTLAMAGVTLVIMLAWHKGLDQVIAEHMQATEPIEDFAARTVGAPLSPIHRAAVFFSRSGVMAPVPLEKMTDLLRIKFEKVIIVSIKIAPHPRVAQHNWVKVAQLNKNVIRLEISLGYLQRINIPAIIAPHLRPLGIEPEDVIYVIGHDRIIAPQRVRSFADINKVLFSFLAATAERAVDRFGLPRRRTLEIGYAIHLTHH
jgi:KUP system potassium uptake protein